MRQFLLPPSYAGEDRLRLQGDDARYLTRVLRLGEGDELPARDRQGTGYGMRIVASGQGWCEVTLSPEPATAPRGPFPEITLLQCLPKGPKMDSIVRQATEAGVARIVPLVSEHTVTQGGDPGHKLARWQRIAREALQQSGNPRMPLLEMPRGLREVRADPGWGTAIVFHESPVDGSSLHAILAEGGTCASVLIGPEGGLSPAEVEYLRGEGFRPAWLGRAVLRVDTAAVAAIALVKQLLWERNEWKLSNTQ